MMLITCLAFRRADPVIGQDVLRICRLMIWQRSVGNSMHRSVATVGSSF